MLSSNKKVESDFPKLHPVRVSKSRSTSKMGKPKNVPRIPSKMLIMQSGSFQRDMNKYLNIYHRWKAMWAAGMYDGGSSSSTFSAIREKNLFFHEVPLLPSPTPEPPG